MKREMRKLTIKYFSDVGELMLLTTKDLPSEEECEKQKQIDIPIEGELYVDPASGLLYFTFFALSPEFKYNRLVKDFRELEEPVTRERFDVPEYELHNVTILDIITYAWKNFAEPRIVNKQNE